MKKEPPLKGQLLRIARFIGNFGATLLAHEMPSTVLSAVASSTSLRSPSLTSLEHRVTVSSNSNHTCEEHVANHNSSY